MTPGIKGWKVEGNMSTRIPLSARCHYQDHLKADGSVNYADSNYHGIIYRPLGGVSDDQIKALYNQFALDTGVSRIDGKPLSNKDAVANRVADRGSFSVEGEDDTRHVHIALILRCKAKSCVTRERYEAAFIVGALDTSVDSKGNRTICSSSSSNNNR